MMRRSLARNRAGPAAAGPRARRDRSRREPGIGKSRIVRQLRARFEGEPYVSLQYQCSPHHTTSPLHPVIEQMERAAGFARDDLTEARLDKLEALLARGTHRLDQAAPLIAALLGVPTHNRYPHLDLRPHRQKQRTKKVLVDQLEGLTPSSQCSWCTRTCTGWTRPHRSF